METAMSTNTGGETVNVANTNLIGTNATSSGVSGGSAGATTLNLKMEIIQEQAAQMVKWVDYSKSYHTVMGCYLVDNAYSHTPGSCTPSTNTYGVTGTMTLIDAPRSTGTLTVTDGTVTETYPAPFTKCPMQHIFYIKWYSCRWGKSYSDSSSGADPTCTNTVTYTAPVACGACTLSLTATVGACVPSTNYTV